MLAGAIAVPYIGLWMSTITVRARVVNVRPRGDDTFGVTLGPGPEVFWYRTDMPPKLGELVTVKNAEARRLRVDEKDNAVTVLEGGEMSVLEEAFARRVVAPEWVARAHAIMRRPLMPFQAEGAGWLAWRLAIGKGSILSDEMGCVDGRAVVRIARGRTIGRSQEITLEKLYAKFHGGTWDPAIPTKIRAACDGVFRLHEVKNVLDKGVRPVVEVRLKSGKKLKLTADHEVCISEDGREFCPAGKLKRGDQVVTNGVPRCRRCQSKKNVVTSPNASFPGFCRTCIYRVLRVKPTWKGGRRFDKDYVRISGMHDHPRSHGGQVPEHILVAEAALGGFRRLDGGVSAKGGLVCFVLKIDHVMSVKPAGQCHVYDVVCADPHRNFVANGIVVHNCGKSTQALAAIASVGATPAILCCPPNVKVNWTREARYLKPRLKIAVVSGSTGPIPPAHIIVVNYDILRARERQLLNLRAKTIVFDEAHLLKEPTPIASHRAAIATRIAHRIGRPILLTGTVLLNRPQELWRLLHILDPRIWSSYADFKHRYCASPDDEDKKFRLIVTEHGQAKRIDELRALAAPYMLRRQITVLKQQLPPKTRRQVMIALEEVDRKNYLAAEKDVVAWLRGFAGDARAMRAKRGQAVVKLNMLRRIAAEGKLRRAVGDYLSAWFSEENGHKPLVIFAYHRRVLAGVEEICRRMGLKVSTISGKDSDKKRQEEIDRFQQGLTSVFIAPIKSAGVGINLQRASDILSLERLWTPSLMNQAEGRCHRLGQRNPVTVTYLDAAGTVDEHIAHVLAEKQRLIDTVVDDASPERATGRSQKQLTIETIDEVVARFGGARLRSVG